jgi:hypothetical protein
MFLAYQRQPDNLSGRIDPVKSVHLLSSFSPLLFFSNRSLQSSLASDQLSSILNPCVTPASSSRHPHGPIRVTCMVPARGCMARSTAHVRLRWAGRPLAALLRSRHASGSPEQQARVNNGGAPLKELEVSWNFTIILPKIARIHSVAATEGFSPHRMIGIAEINLGPWRRGWGSLELEIHSHQRTSILIFR